jgi:predicted aspartyl protease
MRPIARGVRRDAVLLTAALALCGQTPAGGADTVAGVLKERVTQLSLLGAHSAKTLEIVGSLEGLELHGIFHSWHADNDDRYDENLGVRSESTLRRGSREYVRNASGDVRELTGTLALRQRTQDFIFSDDLTDQPQHSHLIGRAKLFDGRDVIQLRVSPPGGDVETVSLDAQTKLIDQIAYTDSDGIETQTYYDYRVVNGALVAYHEVDSNGDARYDETQRVQSVWVDRTIEPSTFAIPASATVGADAPVTVGLIEESGHVFAPVSVRGHTFRFLIDSGAQAVVMDMASAHELMLAPEGLLEISGAKRVGGGGVAALDSLEIGGATLPVRAVSLIDLGGSTAGSLSSNGVLGYPFFAAAEVRLDFDRHTMTFAKPGSLPPLGEKIDLDTDRELPEVSARIDGVPTKALVDCGDGNELLVFKSFVDAHAGLIGTDYTSRIQNYGVGGALSAIPATVDELDVGSYRLFNSRADVVMATNGAFADRVDGANIGMGTLRNFVVTFDLANHAMYLERSASFNDGRDRV